MTTHFTYEQGEHYKPLPIYAILEVHFTKGGTQLAPEDYEEILKMAKKLRVIVNKYDNPKKARK